MQSSKLSDVALNVVFSYWCINYVFLKCFVLGSTIRAVKKVSDLNVTKLQNIADYPSQNIYGKKAQVGKD